jgi:hypothetical protein
LEKEEDSYVVIIMFEELSVQAGDEGQFHIHENMISFSDK